MSDEPIVTVLRAAVDAATRGHHLDPGAAARAWSAAQRPRRRVRPYLAIAATVIVVAGVSAAVAVTQTDHRARTPAGGPSGASACAGNVSTAALPVWARTGFTAAGLSTPHVLGEHGQILAVLFGTLRVHQTSGERNKVLWVGKAGSGPNAGPLHIRAQLEGTAETVTRTVSVGPSYVDMPKAGCWEMTLQWPGYRDTLALRYLP